MDAERQTPDWMHSADTAILQALRRCQPEYVPLVANRLGMQLDYVNERCQRLVEHGLLIRVDGGPVFRLTDRGERYLAGEVEVATVLDEE